MRADPPEPLLVPAVRNAADAEVRYLNLHAPGGGFAEYMRALRDGRPASFDSEDPPAGGGRSPHEASIGGGEVVTEQRGLRVTLLTNVEHVAIFDVSCEPGGPPAQQHLQPRRVQSFYVVADDEFRAGPGAWVQVPPGLSCSFEPSGPGEVRFLSLQA